MENIFSRFPHISHKILTHLDNGSVGNCSKVNRSWNKFIEDEKLPEFRIIQSYTNASAKILWKILRSCVGPSAAQLASDICFIYDRYGYGYLNSIKVGSNRMLITAWKHEK